MMKIITASFIPELKKNTHKHFQILRKIQSLTTQEREITARHIVTSQSRQQFIFNRKIETKQTRLTENLNQLQVHVQFLKHNMKSDDIKL